VRNDEVIQVLNRLANEWQRLDALRLFREPVPLSSSLAFLRMWQAIGDELSRAHSDDSYEDAAEVLLEREMLRQAIRDIRDSVLHERGQLAEAGLDCDQINAVLGIIDDTVVIDQREDEVIE
jgi:hypothetical protein